MKRTSLRFANPPLEALRSTHRGLALRVGLACKYAADVAPFGAVESPSGEALGDLRSLMDPGESTFVVSEEALAADGLRCDAPQGVLQMVFPAELELPEEPKESELQPLTCGDADEMMGLTAVAFPEFFRRRTCLMGRYYGVRVDGRLIAMGGERMAIDEYREISGLCTHPEFRGRGYAARLMARLMHDHRAAGLRSYLHVAARNTGAAALYGRMGFALRGEFPLWRVTRER